MRTPMLDGFFIILPRAVLLDFTDITPVNAAVASTQSDLKVTPLFALHKEIGGKLVDFAGYQLPVQYGEGIIAEHHHTRASASLFDVSHMGQVQISGAAAAVALEALLPLDTEALAIGHQQYTVMLNESGGVVDDLIVSRLGSDSFLLVLNAARLEVDLQHLARHLPSAVEVQRWTDRALLALQGPRSADVLEGLLPAVADLTFLQCAQTTYDGSECFVSRSGYTGEDGFEISLPGPAAMDLARRLLSCDVVQPAGLGARDTLRLEAGLCLYGQDLDEVTSPIEAGLAWAIAPARREGGVKAGGYIGAEMIASQLENGVSRRRVGLRVEGRAPVRAGETLYDADGAELGVVTSGGFAPSVNGPIAHAYVTPSHKAPNTTVYAQVRGRQRVLEVVKMPFVAHRYHRP